MKKIRMTEARKNLFRLADEVTEKDEEVVLSRRGKEDVVLVSQNRWTLVKEKAAKYEPAKKKKSLAGSLILRTDDLEEEIRKVRKEFAESLKKSQSA